MKECLKKWQEEKVSVAVIGLGEKVINCGIIEGFDDLGLCIKSGGIFISTPWTAILNIMPKPKY